MVRKPDIGNFVREAKPGKILEYHHPAEQTHGWFSKSSSVFRSEKDYGTVQHSKALRPLTPQSQRQPQLAKSFKALETDCIGALIIRKRF